MEKIIITATAESIEQVKQLLEAGVDRIYVGEKDFGLRLPTTFSHEELREIAKIVHDAGKELIVAVNALMHQDMMDRIKPFLDFLEEIKRTILQLGTQVSFMWLTVITILSKRFTMPQPWSPAVVRLNFWGQKSREHQRLFWRVKSHLQNFSKCLKF